MWLVRTWNVQIKSFVIVNHRLTIDVGDIHFLTRLSHCEVDLSLFASKAGGDTTYGYLWNFGRGKPPKYGQINTQTIELLHLRTISFTICKLCGSATLDLSTWAQMQTSMEC